MTRSWPIVCVLILVPASVPTACSGPNPVRLDPETTVHMRDRIAANAEMPVDVLVVLDNSSSMAGEQAVVLEFLRAMVRELLDPAWNDTATHAPARDLHLGLVSTDLGAAGADVPHCSDPAWGDDGVLLGGTSECPSGDSRFLSFDEIAVRWGPCQSPDSLDFQRDQWADRMASDFSCMADLGTQGCGYTQPLEAALKALTIHAGPGGPNQGFLRPDGLLYILFITDGDDCSVDLSDPANAAFFEPDFSGEPVSMRCHYHPDRLVPLERYVEAFSGLKQDSSLLGVGLLSGVPLQSPWCSGRPEQPDLCLAEEAMQVLPDPDDPSRPRPSCEDAETEVSASPPRRLYEFAWRMSQNDHDVMVMSLCHDDFTPVLGPLVTKLQDRILPKVIIRYLEMGKDPADASGCSCLVPGCRILIELPEGLACAPPMKPYCSDENGPEHALCEIPQLSTRVSGCPCCVEQGAASCSCDLACSDEAARLFQPSCEQGWWYLPYEEYDDPWEIYPRPGIIFSPTLIQPGYKMEIVCTSDLCPLLRDCGRGRAGGPRCCDPAEYCWNDRCLIRPDVCAEYGENLWCQAPDLPHGGLCCLDHDADGMLDLEDLDGDGVGDRASHVCDGLSCVPR